MPENTAHHERKQLKACDTNISHRTLNYKFHLLWGATDNCNTKACLFTQDTNTTPASNDDETRSEHQLIWTKSGMGTNVNSSL